MARRLNPTIYGFAAQVTLKAPPPLDTALEYADGQLQHEGAVLAVAEPSVLSLDLPQPVSFDQARRREQYFIGKEQHLYPECFVCGPARAAGDGLRLFPGREVQAEPVAASWVPDASLADDQGNVRSELLWAALDCPGYFGVVKRPTKALLGRLTASLERSIPIHTRCVVMGWSLGEQGRKLHAATALWDDAGNLVGSSKQVWITV
jgi:hypothetical protein